MRDWFSQQENLQLLELPSNGCDGNPTEHHWANKVNYWDSGTRQRVNPGASDAANEGAVVVVPRQAGAHAQPRNEHA